MSSPPGLRDRGLGASRSRGRARHKLLVLLGVFALGLIVTEGLLRLRQYRRYGTTATTYYRFAEDPVSGLRIPEPGSRIGPIAINSKGFRGPEIEEPKPAGRIRLAFLGGSTTFCAEASSAASTWPRRVVDTLRERYPEIAFDHVNAAVGGFSTRESLANLERRVARLEPDVLFVYHASNDLTQDSRELAREQGLYEAEDMEAGTLGRYWLTWVLIEKNLRVRGAARTGGTLAVEPAELARPFRARLDALLAACADVAPVTVVGTFCHRARPEHDARELLAACESSLYYMPFLDPESLLACFTEHNRVIREVAAARGVVLAELEHAIPADAEHYNDSIHLRDPGLALMAEKMLAALEAAPAFQELLRSVERP